MSARESKRSKKGNEEGTQVLTWQEKKKQADMEDEALQKEVQELTTWTSLIEAMDEKELKEYVSNRGESFRVPPTVKSPPAKGVHKGGKLSSSSTSMGLMASIWKFHKDDQEETSTP